MFTKNAQDAKPQRIWPQGVTKRGVQCADINGKQIDCPYAFQKLNVNAYYVGLFWDRVVLGYRRRRI